MGQVWGVSMMRDEEDVAYRTVMHMAEEGLDGIVVVDNLSSDHTARELHRAAGDASIPVLVDTDTELGYYQSTKMTNLARRAVASGADWIVPFDADELWLARDRVGFILRNLHEAVMVATAALYDHYPSGIDPEGANPFRTIVWRRPDAAPLPKVAFRWREGCTIHQGNHGVSFPASYGQPLTVPALSIRHFPYRTAEQFIRKARNGAEAYRATSLPEHEGAHWRQYGAILEREGEAGLEAVFRRWFWNLAPVQAGLILDPAPFRRWTQPVPPADKEHG